eukprot:Awhi_evm1s12184
MYLKETAVVVGAPMTDYTVEQLEEWENSNIYDFVETSAKFNNQTNATDYLYYFGSLLQGTK